MDSDEEISFDVVLLSKDGIGIVFSKELLQSCMPVLQTMTPGDWVSWKRKEIRTKMTAEALTIFVKFLQHPHKMDHEVLGSCKVAVQLLLAGFEYNFKPLWDYVSHHMVMANDTWFQQGPALECFDLLASAHPAPYTKELAEKILEWLAMKLGIIWNSFDHQKFGSHGEEAKKWAAGPTLFPEGHVLIFISLAHHEIQEFHVQRSTSVGDLKECFEHFTKHPARELRFLWRGRQIADEETTESLKMWKLDVIHVVFRLGAPTKCKVCLSRKK